MPGPVYLAARPGRLGGPVHARNARIRRAAAWVVSSLAVAGPGLADAMSQELARSPACCRELHYLYEASIFKIDAMRLQVRVGQATAVAVAALVRATKRSSTLEQEVARRYLAAGDATFDMEFLVGVSGATFVSNTVKAIRELGRDGTLSEAEADRFSREARDRFDFLHAARVRPGDRLQYQVVADTVTTTYRRGETVLKLDRQADARARDVILATYFAPSSDFRRGLVAQVFRP